jgi:tetratricopeptide (TPR) repeat protein
MDMGSYPRAVNAFTAAYKALSPNASDSEVALVLVDLAEAQYFSGKYELARSHARDALAQDPRCGPAQVWLGMALLAEGDLSGASHAFTEAQPAAGDIESLTWLALGMARCSALMGQRADAYSHWQKAARFSSGLDLPRLTEAVATVKADLRF